jgi:hypothetical protein
MLLATAPLPAIAGRARAPRGRVFMSCLLMVASSARGAFATLFLKAIQFNLR